MEGCPVQPHLRAAFRAREAAFRFRTPAARNHPEFVSTILFVGTNPTLEGCARLRPSCRIVLYVEDSAIARHGGSRHHWHERPGSDQQRAVPEPVDFGKAWSQGCNELLDGRGIREAMLISIWLAYLAVTIDGPTPFR